MYKGISFIGLIPARKGSKRLPGKNLLKIKGKTLLELAIDSGKTSKLLDEVIVSTDSDEMRDLALELGAQAPRLRASQLSSDEATSVDVAIDALGWVSRSYDYLVLLQPTSPFRVGTDIDEAISKMIDGGYNSAVSVSEPLNSPYHMYYKRGEGIQPILGKASQKEEIYCLNGAIFVIKVSELLSKKSFGIDQACMFNMEPSRSIDIDKPFDFELATRLA